MQMVMGADAFMPMPSALGARSSILPAAASRPVPPLPPPCRERCIDQYFPRLQPLIFNGGAVRQKQILEMHTSGWREVVTCIVGLAERFSYWWILISEPRHNFVRQDG